VAASFGTPDTSSCSWPELLDIDALPADSRAHRATRVAPDLSWGYRTRQTGMSGKERHGGGVFGRRGRSYETRRQQPAQTLRFIGMTAVAVLGSGDELTDGTVCSNRRRHDGGNRFISKIPVYRRARTGAIGGRGSVRIRRSISSPPSARMQIWLSLLCRSMPIWSMAGPLLLAPLSA